MNLNQQIFRQDLMALMMPDLAERRRAASHHRYAQMIDDYGQREAISGALDTQRLARESLRSPLASGRKGLR